MSYRWTADQVELLVVQAFREFPEQGIWSPAKSVFKSVDGSPLPPGPIKVFVWSARYLGRESPERIALLLWGRHKAIPREALRDLVREMGWEWRTFLRRRNRACVRIAEGLRRDRIPYFDGEWHLVPALDHPP